MSVTIREATVDDASLIAGFQVAMALETEQKTLLPAVVDKAVLAVFEDPSRGFYLVGEVDGRVVGSLMITYEWSDWRNSNMWYIQSLFVEKEQRGQGIFKKLYQKVLEMAKARNVMFVRLYVEAENERAQKAYESIGMKRMPYLMYCVEI